MQHLLFQYACYLKVSLFRLLLHSESPPSVLYQVGIEYVRSDIKRIMRLQILIPCDFFIQFQDLPCKEHPQRLSTDKAGAKQPFPYFEQIFERKFFPYQERHPRVPGDHHSAYPGDHFLLFRCFPGFFQQLFRFQKESIPVVEPPFGAARFSMVNTGVQIGCVDTVYNGDTIFTLFFVREKHCR